MFLQARKRRPGQQTETEDEGNISSQRRPGRTIDEAIYEAGHSNPRRVDGLDASLNIEMLAGLVGRARRRREKRRAREMRGLLDQPDQRWRVATHANDLQTVADDAQLGQIRVIRQNLRQSLDDDDGRRYFVFAAFERGKRGIAESVAPNQRAGGPLPARRRWRSPSWQYDRRTTVFAAGMAWDSAMSNWRALPACGLIGQCYRSHWKSRC